ncbi:hypothetical protein [Microbacterium gubbeenense]|uniref:hypothetical protein n=1 Tax=Microbacterium gubbeenense TaxID=159896 RepID=UPI0003F75A96|nr:hypothetical protein [Microbacterium gubbeenense]
MSLAETDLIPFETPTRRPEPERTLQALPNSGRRRRPRLAYALTAIAGAAVIAAAQLGLSTLTAQSSYELAAVESQQHQLTLDQQQLTDQIAGLSSPQYLAANASALGMVIDSSPSYLRLSDSSIMGAGTPASGTSTVNMSAGNAAANSLIADTPLVTAEDETVAESSSPSLPESVPSAPPIDGGLPAPATH